MQYINHLNFNSWSGNDLPLHKPSPFHNRPDGLYPASLVIKPVEGEGIILCAHIGVDSYKACVGLEREIEIPNQITVSKLRRVGKSPDVAALCLRMLAGYSKRWDGRDHYGDWDTDAEDAFIQLQQIVASIVK